MHRIGYWFTSGTGLPEYWLKRVDWQPQCRQSSKKNEKQYARTNVRAIKTARRFPRFLFDVLFFFSSPSCIFAFSSGRRFLFFFSPTRIHLPCKVIMIPVSYAIVPPDNSSNFDFLTSPCKCWTRPFNKHANIHGTRVNWFDQRYENEANRNGTVNGEPEKKNLRRIHRVPSNRVVQMERKRNKSPSHRWVVDRWKAFIRRSNGLPLNLT